MHVRRSSLLALSTLLLFAGSLLGPAAQAAPTIGDLPGLPVEPCAPTVPTPVGNLGGPVPCGDPCQTNTPSDFQSPLCPFGPAGCVAVGLYAKVGSLTTQLARSTANAGAGAQGGPGYSYGYGFSQSDAHTAKADLPPELGSGAVESYCSANAYADTFGNIFTGAFGSADAARVFIDASSLGQPPTLYADALSEYGASFPFCASGAYNCADVADLEVYNPPQPSNYYAVPPNTVIPLGPLGAIYLNEQFPGFYNVFGNCLEHDGDAARIVLGPATVIVSWVATCGSPSAGGGGG
jgi:hypothetical protein